MRHPCHDLNFRRGVDRLVDLPRDVRWILIKIPCNTEVTAGQHTPPNFHKREVHSLRGPGLWKLRVKNNGRKQRRNGLFVNLTPQLDC